jgi:hypothetical protein
MGVEQVEPRGRTPVAEEARLDVIEGQWPAEQGVVEQVDLADGEVVGGPPPRVDEREVIDGGGHGRGSAGRHDAMLPHDHGS